MSLRLLRFPATSLCRLVGLCGATAAERKNALPVYVETIKPASTEEFRQWQALGYLGTWEQYTAAKERSAGGTMFVRGELGAHCGSCMAVGDFLCDYPVGEAITCDRPMCGAHAHEIGPDLHYCQAHYQMWVEFKARGGVDASLRNVIAFKNEK